MGFMRHQHFKSLSSTQSYLVELTPQYDDQILISAEEQTGGVGQRERQWVTFKNALAMSFTFHPNEVMTLTSLELAVLLCKFFREEFQKEIFLKWPNDILNAQGEKLGGILISKNTSGPCIVGMGINLSNKETQKLPNCDYPINGIFKDAKEIQLEVKELSEKLYLYFLKNRLSAHEVREMWMKFCLHLNKEIRFIENTLEEKYLFKGIGENGEALLEDASRKIIFKFSGSIRI